MMKKRFFYALMLSVLLSTVLGLSVNGAEASFAGASIQGTGFDNPAALSDADYNTYTTAWEDGSISVSLSDSIQGLYVVFDRIPDSWQLSDPVTGTSLPCGTNSFLHEYVDINALVGTDVHTLILTFPKGTVIADVYVFSEGELPEWVQRWDPPCEEADLLLFTSHSDDEQLFFAGILPLYAGEKGYSVQVAYIVQHFQVWEEKVHNRPHEQLNGLWAVGVTHYPVMSDFPDLYSESLEGAISAFNSVGVTEEDYSAYITECIRRFKPLVVVSHDINGEYGHGTHIYCTKTLRDALEISHNPDIHPESAAKWGTWVPEKVYLHLYPENPVVLDLDTPLSAFGGKTAFEMTQHGFSYHKSQHWTWFYRWIYGTADAPITKASQITSYSPCHYGLYYSTVGVDTVGGDLFENVIPYAVRNLPVETLPPETEPVPETSVWETEPEETAIAETNPNETDAAETDSDETSTDPTKDSADGFAKGFLALIIAAVIAVFAVYAVSMAQLNRRRKQRRNRRR